MVTDVTANDGAWTFLCASWASQGGLWKIYKNGALADHGQGLAEGLVIGDKGTLVLGQEQDSPGGGFSAAESFRGRMYGLTMWSTSLESLQV